MADAPALIELRYSVDGPVATIVLDRPDALNSLTVALKVELLAAVRAADSDRDIRALILTGAGRAFCAGQDLRERLEPGAAPLDVELRERYNPIVRALRGTRLPVVAAVNGVAAGAGASLAMACDIRIAAESASFVLAFDRVGLIPDSGATWLLPRLVGAGRATEIAMLGDPVDADTALRIGLVNRVVAADALMADAAAMAARLAAGAPQALALTKRTMEAAWDLDLGAALEAEATAQGGAGRTSDHAEGVAAFVEKRKPQFTGE
jgi:2-(1,2-epoxy-1,2-dihydrophenyl)acetyl-CoA isomerase